MVSVYWYHNAPYNEEWGLRLSLVLKILLLIFCTHAYKILAERKRWTNLTLPRILPIALSAYAIQLCIYMLSSWLSFQLYLYYCNCAAQFSNAALGALTGGLRYHAIWLLAFHGYHYARQNADERAESARLSQLAAEAKLSKLSGELNPHFLFNALTGIKALTRSDPRSARRGIDQLSDILRYSLKQSARPLVPWAEEKGMTERYLALEQLRFEERLIIKWVIPSEAENFSLPPLTLHTLVENAIKHGISKIPSGGTIDITLKTFQAHWKLTVSNPGNYAPKEAGSGLNNLRQRLQLQYPGEAKLTIKEDLDCRRVIASVILPA